MRQIKKMQQRGLLDPEKEDPFALFVASTDIRYCYYNDTHQILGNTYGMCVLQVCRFLHIVCIFAVLGALLRHMSFSQVYTTTHTHIHTHPYAYTPVHTHMHTHYTLGILRHTYTHSNTLSRTYAHRILRHSHPHPHTHSPLCTLTPVQDFEALTPNLLARTIETVQGGGLVVLLLSNLKSLSQLYTLTMDVHARLRTESHQDVVGMLVLLLLLVVVVVAVFVMGYCFFFVSTPQLHAVYTRTQSCMLHLYKKQHSHIHPPIHPPTTPYTPTNPFPPPIHPPLHPHPPHTTPQAASMSASSSPSPPPNTASYSTMNSTSSPPAASPAPLNPSHSRQTEPPTSPMPAGPMQLTSSSYRGPWWTPSPQGPCWASVSRWIRGGRW